MSRDEMKQAKVEGTLEKTIEKAYRIWYKHIGYKYEKKYIRRCPDCMFWSEQEEGNERKTCPRCRYEWCGWGTDVKYHTWYTYLFSCLCSRHVCPKETVEEEKRNRERKQEIDRLFLFDRRV